MYSQVKHFQQIRKVQLIKFNVIIITVIIIRRHHHYASPVHTTFGDIRISVSYRAEILYDSQLYISQYMMIININTDDEITEMRVVGRHFQASPKYLGQSNYRGMSEQLLVRLTKQNRSREMYSPVRR